MHCHIKTIYDLVLGLALSLWLTTASAASTHDLEALHHQPTSLLKQCLNKPLHDWHFAERHYLTYQLPNSSCFLVVESKHKTIAHAKLLDKHGFDVLPYQCHSPTFICLGLET